MKWIFFSQSVVYIINGIPKISRIFKTRRSYIYIYIYIYIYDRIGLYNNNTLWLIQESNESFFGLGEIWIQIPYLIIRDFTCWVSGCFCNKGWKCENCPNLPVGSLEVFIVENQVQNSKSIMNKRLMVLWQERIKMLIIKV